MPSETMCHENLIVLNEPDAGLQGVISIHSTVLGPAAGGCRIWSYNDQSELATDAMRLSEGMTYKNALAGLPFGGGKAVLLKPSELTDRSRFLRAFGSQVERLGGRYVTAEDVGSSVRDMSIVRSVTRHAAGVEPLPGRAGGNPSPWTALGVFLSIEQAVKQVRKTNLEGLRVAIQGVGQVGSALARMLHEAGASLVLADSDGSAAKKLADEVGAKIVLPEEIARVRADVFAPCALGGVLNAKSIPELRAQFVIGAANNQLATADDGDELARRGVVYGPDYLVNAGGIINVSAEYLGETEEDVRSRISEIPLRLLEILEEAAYSRKSTNRIAETMAKSIINERRRQRAA